MASSVRAWADDASATWTATCAARRSLSVMPPVFSRLSARSSSALACARLASATSRSRLRAIACQPEIGVVEHREHRPCASRDRLLVLEHPKRVARTLRPRRTPARADRACRSAISVSVRSRVSHGRRAHGNLLLDGNRGLRLGSTAACRSSSSASEADDSRNQDTMAKRSMHGNP